MKKSQSLLSVIDEWILKINRWNWSCLVIFVMAWTLVFTYLHSQWLRAETNYKSKASLLDALTVELSLMESWAQHTYHDASLQSYQSQNQHFNWYDPSYHLLGFERSIFESLLQNPTFLEFDDTLINNFIRLSQRVASLFEKSEQFMRFKFAFPDLYEQGYLWTRKLRQNFPKIDMEPDTKYYSEILPHTLDPRLRNYLEIVYAQNYKIYVCGIGGNERRLSDCGVEKIGIHALWTQCQMILANERQRLISPSVHAHLRPFYLLLFIFILPSVYSFFRRISDKGGRTMGEKNGTTKTEQTQTEQEIKKVPAWSPEWEQRYQFVGQIYDKARGVGLDILKIFLSTTIVIAGVPIVFYDKIRELFPGKEILWIFSSWVSILLALILGFIAYLLIFEGYYHHAHHEESRLLGGSHDKIIAFDKKTNQIFDIGHWVGLGAAVLFGFAVLSVIIPIALKFISIARA